MKAARLAAALIFALGAGAAMAQPGEDENPPPAEAPASEAPTSEAPAREAPSPETLALNPLAALDKAALEGFRDRPLFTPSRRRPEPPEEVAVEAPPPPPPTAPKPAAAPELKLAGVIEGPAGAVAVVENAENGGKIERLRLGDQVGGWLVTAIDGSSLKLTLDDREEQYRIFERKEAGEAAPELDGDGAPMRRPSVREGARSQTSDDEEESEQ